MNLAALNRLLQFLERESTYDVDDGPTLSDRIAGAKTYVDNRLYRALVVSVLPVDAPPGQLMVKAGDINLYIGTGTGNPLRKIPTQATP